MRNKFYILLTLLCSLTGVAAAQTIVGKVTGASGAVPGAAIQVVGTTIGTATDADGNFRLTNVSAGNVTVKVSSIGFKDNTQSIVLKAGETRTLNISLDDATKFLEEVIVTGLSINAKQKELGTSRANLSSSVIESLPAPSVESALVGRLAGVEAYSTDGAPGGGFRFRIRGANSISGASEPLLILDGIIMDNANRNAISGQAGGNNATGSATFGMQNGTRGLGSLNPEDIESIEILKGAAAASLYGSRAASGVIVVKTKSGGQGKLKLDYSLDFGSTKVSRNVGKYKMDWTGDEISTWANLIDPAKATYKDADIAQYKVNPLTDYPLESFRTGSFSRNTVRVQGGTKKLGYYFSGNNQNTVGQIKGADFKSKGALFSLSSQPVAGLTMKVSLNYQDADRAQIASGTPGFFVPNRWANDGLAMPFMRYSDVKVLGAGFKTLDDYALLAKDTHSKRYSVSGNLNYKILSNLSLDVTGGIDKSEIKGQILYPVGLVTLFPTGRLDQDYEKITQKTFTVGLNHAWKINEKLYLKSAVGTQYDENERFYDFVRYQTITAGKNERDTSSYTAPQRGSFVQVLPIVKTFGIYFNETIGIGEKLFLNLGGRIDRSTSFTEQSFFYPRASLSYQVSPTFRVRTAYGSSGTQPAAYTSTLSFRQLAIGWNNSRTAYVPNVPPNTGLRPETQEEFEIGFDASALNGRVTVEATYYNKQFKDLLLASIINPALNYGLTTGIRNVGSMYNRGLELMISADVIRTEDINWNVSFTGFTLQNKVTSMPEPKTPLGGGTGVDDVVQIREGYPMSGIWAGVPASAATDAPEVAKTAGGAVRVFRGNTIPSFEGNINTTFQYKGFSINALIGGKGGFYKYNLTARNLANPAKRQHSDYWNMPTAQLTPIYNDSNNWVERGDFIKLRQLGLSYVVPKAMLDQTKFIKRLSVALTGSNLFTSSKYSGGYDVESETNGSSAANASWAWVRGIDSWDGGMPKTYTLSVNIGF